MLGISNLVQLVGFVAWPLAVLALVVVIVSSKAGSSFLAGFGGRISSLKGFGFELGLEPEKAAQAKVDFESELAEYRGVIRKRFDALNHQHDVIRLRDRLVEELLLPALKPDVEGMRCTIYVPDIVFSDALYRLTDYYPTGEGSGAVYSIRFGIIGRQWRLRESTYEPQVPSDPQTLMSLWGMTLAQANAKSRDKSFLVAMLRHGDVEQGLLLMSAETPHPFARADMCEEISGAEHTRALAERVALVNGEMRKRGPALKLFNE